MEWGGASVAANGSSPGWSMGHVFPILGIAKMTLCSAVETTIEMKCLRLVKGWWYPFSHNHVSWKSPSNKGKLTLEGPIFHFMIMGRRIGKTLLGDEALNLGCDFQVGWLKKKININQATFLKYTQSPLVPTQTSRSLIWDPTSGAHAGVTFSFWWGISSGALDKLQNSTHSIFKLRNIHSVPIKMICIICNCLMEIIQSILLVEEVGWNAGQEEPCRHWMPRLHNYMFIEGCYVEDIFYTTIL